jgi:hypothetical protein
MGIPFPAPLQVEDGVEQTIGQQFRRSPPDRDNESPRPPLPPAIEQEGLNRLTARPDDAFDDVDGEVAFPLVRSFEPAPKYAAMVEGIEPRLPAGENLEKDVIEPLGPLKQAEHKFDLFVCRGLGVAEQLDSQLLQVKPNPISVEKIPHRFKESFWVVVPEQEEELSQLSSTEQ